MLTRIHRQLRRVLCPPLHSPDVKVAYEFLGNSYGGWPLLGSTPANSLIFSFGVGQDISFDLAAVQKFLCRVHAFDPTPKSREWIARQQLPADLVFHPVGIAAYDGQAEFYAPQQDGHVSFSISPSRGAAARPPVIANVMRLQTIIDQLGLGYPDILKMDIEGFEYDVVKDMILGRIRPSQLLIEFHHGMYGISNEKTIYAVRLILQSNYRLFFVSETGREYGFLKVANN